MDTSLVTQTKMTIFRPIIILERVHFLDAVIIVKHETYWDILGGRRATNHV
jgi:hypothetical protein